jgi:hypothetical protein
MELSPRPARRARAVLLGQPLARATQLEPRAVHEEMQGLGIAATTGVAAGARPRLWHLQRRGPATERRVVWSGTRSANPSGPTTEPISRSAWR